MKNHIKRCEKNNAKNCYKSSACVVTATHQQCNGPLFKNGSNIGNHTGNTIVNSHMFNHGQKQTCKDCQSVTSQTCFGATQPVHAMPQMPMNLHKQFRTRCMNMVKHTDLLPTPDSSRSQPGPLPTMQKQSPWSTLAL